MSSFTTPLAYVPTSKQVHGRQVFRLTEAFAYEVGHKGSGVAITVPAGFETDFASIPKWADDWFGLNPNGKYAKAAVIHDWLYTNPIAFSRILTRARRQGLLSTWDIKQLRYFADFIFFEAMGVPPVKGLKRIPKYLTRIIMFTAVRLFGARYFNRKYKTLKGE